MRVIDLNRNGGIGANSLFLELDSFNFIVDAGLNPKFAGNLATPDYTLIEDADVHFIVITHCHLDHIGSLPVLMRKHPEARVFMSS